MTSAASFVLLPLQALQFGPKRPLYHTFLPTIRPTGHGCARFSLSMATGDLFRLRDVNTAQSPISSEKAQFNRTVSEHKTCWLSQRANLGLAASVLHVHSEHVRSRLKRVCEIAEGTAKSTRSAADTRGHFAVRV